MKTKRILAALLSAIMVLSMAGCGNSSSSSSSSSEGESKAETTKAETTAAETTAAETKAETSAEAESDEENNETQKPEAPTLNSAKAVGNKIQIKFTLPENISGYRVIWGTEEDVINKKMKYADVTSINDTEKVISNLNYATEYGVALYSFVDNNGDRVYSDISKMLDVTTGKKPSQTKKNTTADNSTIDPTFKETMDSCEQFFDQYVEFMKKYKNATAADLMSMMSDYSSFLTQYSEFTKKLNSIDKNNLNAAELAYYTKVMANITAKLSEVGQ